MYVEESLEGILPLTTYLHTKWDIRMCTDTYVYAVVLSNYMYIRKYTFSYHFHFHQQKKSLHLLSNLYH